LKRLAQKYFYFLLAGITYLIVHEGAHIIQALLYGVYEGIRLLPLGIEIVFTQPLPIKGFKVAALSGLSSVVTVVTGYILLICSLGILKSSSLLVAVAGPPETVVSTVVGWKTNLEFRC